MKRFFKDLLFILAFVIIFNMMFSGRDGIFGFSLLIAFGGYFWILFFRFIFWILGKFSGKNSKSTSTNNYSNSSTSKTIQNTNNSSPSIGKELFYDDVFFHHDHFKHK